MAPKSPSHVVESGSAKRKQFGAFEREDPTIAEDKPAKLAAGTHHARNAKGTTPPPNVIPFGRPRAIANVAGNAGMTPAASEAQKLSRPVTEQTNIAARHLPPRQGAKSTQWPAMAPVAGSLAKSTTQRPAQQFPATAPPAIVSANAAAAIASLAASSSSVPAPSAAPVPAPAPDPFAGWPNSAAKAAPPAAKPTPAPMPQQPAPVPQQSAPVPPQPAASATLPDWATAPAPAPAPKHDPHKWAVYDKLGLGAPKLNTQKLGKLIVTAYRLLGFAILSIIVIVLVGYISTTLFFYLSSSWVVPVAVSPSDEKVVTLQAQLAEQQNTRDKIADELSQADRSVLAQQDYQAAFVKAIKSDLDNRKTALGKIRALASTARNTRVAIASSNSAYASSSQKRMAEEYKAGLIDRNSMLSGKFQLAQITSSNLSLAERQAEYENQAAELEQQATSLDAILANASTDSSLSYAVLQIRQQYEASQLELAKAIEDRNSLKVSLDRQDKLVMSLKQAALLRAINDKAAVAFVPYGNLPKVSKNAGLYACRASMVICRKVGTILEVLPGEVQFKHPHKDKMLRGQMVEMKMDDDEMGAAEDDVLFVGGKPLLF